ncbi:ricin-type beta-trefoil lectin domain protein [Streptomyces sp. NPDC002187]|uniref:ricin-type beta-trefoil lectin domain protein n=1 Tax=Streptomyces sp. NPDC002187 TaxID=3364637 RepID=UPI003679B452
MFTTVAFAQLMENLAHTGAPAGALRPHLLVATRHIAKAWASDERVAALLPGLLIPELPSENRQLVSRAFHAMPLTAQVLLWHAEVEAEGISIPAGLLGIDPRLASDQLEHAREQFRQGCLRAHRELATDQRCRHFNRLLDVSLRRGGALIPDIQQHLANCRHCRYAADQLRQSGGRLGQLLAEALLGRAAQPYLESRPGRRGTQAQARAEARRPGRHSRGGRARAMPRLAVLGKHVPLPFPPRMLVAGTALAVVGLLVLSLVASAWSDDDDQAGPVVPSGAVTGPSPTASAPGTGTGTAQPSGTAPQPSTTSAAHPGGPLTTRLRNAESNLCLDIPTVTPEPGTDVSMAVCSSAPAQQWVYESDGRLRSALAPELCLDSHGLDGIVVLDTCTTTAAPDAVDVRYDLTIQGQMIPRWNDRLAVMPAAPEPDSPVVVKVRDDSISQVWATDTMGAGTARQSGTATASPYAAEVGGPAKDEHCAGGTCPRRSTPAEDDAAPSQDDGARKEARDKKAEKESGQEAAEEAGEESDEGPVEEAEEAAEDDGLRRVSDSGQGSQEPRSFGPPSAVPAVTPSRAQAAADEVSAP